MLSRIDGNQTLRDVLLATGLPVDRGVAIIQKPALARRAAPAGRDSAAPASLPRAAEGLSPHRGPTPRRITAELGADAKPERPDAATRAATRAAPAARNPRRRRGHAALDGATVRRAPSAASTSSCRTRRPRSAALAEDVEIDATSAAASSRWRACSTARDPWALLGVPQGAEAKVLKRAYFKLSKEIHPDRYYGKQLGSFAERLTQVFEAVSRAYAKLTTPDAAASAEHRARRGQRRAAADAAGVRGRAVRARMQLEVGGDALGAMKLFAAAVRIDPQTRYLRRAASCALAASQPKTAVEYAKKAQTQAPNDASSARLLAAAFQAAGKLADAEEVSSWRWR